jgi:adenylate kinase
LHIIILGAPGSGKGTQAGNTAKEMKLLHISSGDLFRRVIDRNDELSATVRKYMSKGLLVPDEITIKMILENLKVDDIWGGVILDGFPRNLNQAKALDEALKRQNKNIDRVVYIKVNERELIRRLKSRWLCRHCQTPNQGENSIPRKDERCKICGGELYQRADDNEKTIKRRLDIYYKDTIPVIEYYRKKGELLEVDGEGSIQDITIRIIDILKRCNYITK